MTVGVRDSGLREQFKCTYAHPARCRAAVKVAADVRRIFYRRSVAMACQVDKQVKRNENHDARKCRQPERRSLQISRILQNRR
jgi:hypothetical protein